MRILYVGMKYDYGKPEQGYSFEHYNFFECLRHMGHDIIYFDFFSLMEAHGQAWMNQRLLEIAQSEKPELMFTFLYKDELNPRTIRAISESSATTTFNWFADDHWRFDNYSCHWAPCFNWVSTTAQSAVPKYEKMGYRNLIKTQWASNPFLYRKLDLPLKYPVTFIGQPHGNRRAIIEALRSAGIEVQAWGSGWENGRVTQEQMIEVFNQSRINLNLTNASVLATPPGKPPLKEKVRRAAGRTLQVVPFGSQIKSAVKRQMAARPPEAQPATPATATPIEVPSDNQPYAEQIKGRNFEVPGCGGFILTGPADNLEAYYDLNREVACFHGTADLVDKVRYYLAHEDERAAVAEAGYRRTLNEHTYVHRFNAIFDKIGLPHQPAADLLAGQAKAGQVEEIS